MYNLHSRECESESESESKSEGKIESSLCKGNLLWVCPFYLIRQISFQLLFKYHYTTRTTSIFLLQITHPHKFQGQLNNKRSLCAQERYLIAVTILGVVIFHAQINDVTTYKDI